MSRAARCNNDSAAGLDISAGVGCAKPRQGKHDDGIEGELELVPNGEAVGLDARCNCRRRAEVGCLFGASADARRATCLRQLGIDT